MRKIVGKLALSFSILLVAQFAYADTIEKEHEKAKSGGYEKELDRSIKKHGGDRLKQEDQKVHEPKNTTPTSIKNRTDILNSREREMSNAPGK